MQADLQHFESLCECLYGNKPANASGLKSKQDANQSLNQFTSDPANFVKLKCILENSKHTYGRYLAASALKQILSENWGQIEKEHKIEIRNYLISTLKDNNIVMVDKSIT